MIFTALLFLGFLFIEADAWTLMFGAAGSLFYSAVAGGSSWESLFMLCVLAVFAVKNFEELHAAPGKKGRLVRWLQAVIRGT